MAKKYVKKFRFKETKLPSKNAFYRNLSKKIPAIKIMNLHGKFVILRKKRP